MVEPEDSENAWGEEPEVAATSYQDVPQALLVPYAIIAMEDIEKIMNNDFIKKTRELFCTTEDTAITLLKIYKWNSDKLTQEYFANTNNVLCSCGLIPDPKAMTDEGSSSNCLICLESLAGKPVDNLICGHKFCGDCWSMYCQAAVKSGKDCVMTRCPLVGCPIIVPKSIFVKHLPTELSKEYTKHVCKSFTDENRAMKWCPAPGCKYIALNESLARMDINCKCGKIFCFGCGEETHVPCTCKLMKQWSIKNSAESENITWIMANTKACPKCDKPIEKNQGCNHMTCVQCRNEFCWICMGPWSIHGEKTGGYYKCNRFEGELKSNQSLKEGEAKREKAKSELAKYSFYFERYNNHDKAMKIAMKEYDQTDPKILELHTKKKFPFSELQFLKNAAESMISVRRVLKNSYVYGYYIDDQTEKVLFENLQGRLEENCDHLHQLLEKDLGEFTKENVVDDGPFFKYKSELTNYFEITKKFFRNFCEGVKSGLAQGNI